MFEEKAVLKMKLLFVASLLLGLVERFHGLSCGDCDHDNITASCGPPPSCTETALDACGCCPLCAKMAGESCGGPWDSYGTCAKGLTCQPDTTATPVLGAGGYFSENWDPVGTCVDPVAYKLEHSPCMRQLAAFLEFQKSRDKRSAGDSKSKLEKFPEIDLTTPTDLITMLVTETVAAESTQAQETVTAESTQTQMNETPPTTMRTTEAETTTGGREENTTVGCVRKPSCTPDGFYTPTQCDGCVGECWCSFIDGKEISGTRGPARTVRC